MTAVASTEPATFGPADKHCDGRAQRVMLPTDKGNATVLLDREAYNRKTQDILESLAYEKPTKDPTPRNQKNKQAPGCCLQATQRGKNNLPATHLQGQLHVRNL